MNSLMHQILVAFIKKTIENNDPNEALKALEYILTVLEGIKE